MKVVKLLDKIFKFEVAEAHCDVPCGIYDPYPAQIAAHTVIRMNMLIAGLAKDDPEHHIKFSRYVAVKEEAGELVKHEVRIIWGDFMKAETTGDFPGLNNLVWKIMKQGGAARQTTSLEKSKELLASVLEFSEIFWKLKGKATKRITAPYPSEGELVVLA